MKQELARQHHPHHHYLVLWIVTLVCSIQILDWWLQYPQQITENSILPAQAHILQIPTSLTKKFLDLKMLSIVFVLINLGDFTKEATEDHCLTPQWAQDMTVYWLFHILWFLWDQIKWQIYQIWLFTYCYRFHSRTRDRRIEFCYKPHKTSKGYWNWHLLI